MRASGACFKNAMLKAARPLKYCGLKPGAAGGVSRLMFAGGCSPSAAVPRISQKSGRSRSGIPEPVTVRRAERVARVVPPADPAHTHTGEEDRTAWDTLVRLERTPGL